MQVSYNLPFPFVPPPTCFIISQLNCPNLRNIKGVNNESPDQFCVAPLLDSQAV